MHHSAYIAASRRSDRSLEARVESARRASEIHKRRTGRSLRVTEQDVVNEEMYEEEDDDLPLQYRRLTAHLQTGSADFNRRLAAYLTNHVAMRSALDQAITNSYAQQYPNAPQFAHNQQTMFPSPMMAQGMGQMPQQMHPMQRPHQPSSNPYRQSPYPVPGAPGYRPSPHSRSSSGAKSQDLPGHTASSPVDPHTQLPNRRIPMPTATAPVSPATPATPHTPLPGQSTQIASAPKPAPHSSDPASSAPQSMGPPATTMSAQQTATQQAPQSMHYGSQGYPDFSLFSTSLPPESQMLLGSTLNPNDPLASMLMAGSENFPQPYFNYNDFNNLNSGNFLKSSNFHPSYDGMNATLAPSALDINPPRASYPEPTSGTAESTPVLSFNHGFDGNPTDYKGVSFMHPGSTGGSGTVTPGIDGSWDAFIDDNSWTENAA